MSFKNRWSISSRYHFQVHQQRSQRCSSQTALLWFEVLPGLSPALPGLSPALPRAPRLVVGAPSYSDGWQECPPRVWYSPEIDASKFTLHILSDTPGGFQWLKSIFADVGTFSISFVKLGLMADPLMILTLPSLRSLWLFPMSMLSFSPNYW